MLSIKTLNSLKINLIIKGSILILVLIIYLAFIYIMKRYNNNANDFALSFVVETADILSIIILSLILLITGSFVFTMSRIFKYKSSIDSSLNVKVDTSLDQNNVPFDKTEAEIIKNERLYIMGNMAAGIIHDFKTPISTISLCAQAILEGYADKDQTNHYLKKIEDQVDRMVNMTQDFLDYARGQKSLNIQEIEFTKTIKNQIEFHRNRAMKKNVRLSYTLPDPFYIKIDPHKFRRVLDNIVVNALEVLKSEQTIQINFSTCEAGFKMKISDNGPGISPDILPKIFEPFFSHGKSKGSGLGLSISKKIVEDHGGSLTVQSQFGQGCTFTILLPDQLLCDRAEKQIFEKSEITFS